MPDAADSNSLGVWIIGALLIAFVLILISRYLHRDSEVKSTKFGFYIDRTRYDEQLGDVWTAEPLPPPAPPPPLPPRPPDDEKTQVIWPNQEGEKNG